MKESARCVRLARIAGIKRIMLGQYYLFARHMKNSAEIRDWTLSIIAMAGWSLFMGL